MNKVSKEMADKIKDYVGENGCLGVFNFLDSITEQEPQIKITRETTEFGVKFTTTIKPTDCKYKGKYGCAYKKDRPVGVDPLKLMKERSPMITRHANWVVLEALDEIIEAVNALKKKDKPVGIEPLMAIDIAKDIFMYKSDRIQKDLMIFNGVKDNRNKLNQVIDYINLDSKNKTK